MAIYDHNTQTVDTVADLVGLSVADGQLVNTLGYYAAGDGGGNLYRYLLGSAAACDGGFILDGVGGENTTAAAAAASYAGTSGDGRFGAVNSLRVQKEAFGADLGDGGDAFRLTAWATGFTDDTNLGGDLLLQAVTNQRKENTVDPVLADFPNDKDFGIFKNTVTGDVAFIHNDDGTLIGIPLVEGFVPGIAAMAVESNASDESISGTSTDFSNSVQVSAFGVDNSLTEGITPDHTNDHFTINEPGIYKIEVSLSMEGGNNKTFSLAFFKNNGATQLGSRVTTKTNSNGDVQAFSLVTVEGLVDTDTVELWIQNETDTANPTVQDGYWIVTKIG